MCQVYGMSYPMKLFASLVQPLLISTVHHEHQSGCVLNVILPVGPHLPLPPNIPHSQSGAAPMRLQRLHVEAHRWHCNHALVVFEFVQQGGLPRAVQAQHENLRLLLRYGPKHSHVWRAAVECLYPELSPFLLGNCKPRWLCSEWLVSYVHQVTPSPLVPALLQVKLFMSKVTMQLMRGDMKHSGLHSHWSHISPVSAHQTHQQPGNQQEDYKSHWLSIHDGDIIVIFRLHWLMDKYGFYLYTVMAAEPKLGWCVP